MSQYDCCKKHEDPPCCATVVQMIPAVGHRAWFVCSDETIVSELVVAWGLKCDGEIVPLVVSDGVLESCHLSNYCIGVHPNGVEPSSDYAEEVVNRMRNDNKKHKVV